MPCGRRYGLPGIASEIHWGPDCLDSLACYGLPGIASEIHCPVPTPRSGLAMVCRESLLRYTGLRFPPPHQPAMVCRESLLRYTRSANLVGPGYAMVCRESLLRYTLYETVYALDSLWFAGN